MTTNEKIHATLLFTKNIGNQKKELSNENQTIISYNSINEMIDHALIQKASHACIYNDTKEDDYTKQIKQYIPILNIVDTEDLHRIQIRNIHIKLELNDEGMITEYTRKQVKDIWLGLSYKYTELKTYDALTLLASLTKYENTAFLDVMSNYHHQMRTNRKCAILSFKPNQLSIDVDHERLRITFNVEPTTQQLSLTIKINHNDKKESHNVLSYLSLCNHTYTIDAKYRHHHIKSYNAQSLMARVYPNAIIDLKPN